MPIISNTCGMHCGGLVIIACIRIQKYGQSNAPLSYASEHARGYVSSKTCEFIQDLERTTAFSLLSYRGLSECSVFGDFEN